ncbi:PH domain-containing protein [Rhizomonospora bruguierae]|uniref:PH domain-containing protein n=1 Tax=Rhizomonospora bruguierae TaxID=1581705 RepID=UPI001BCB010C|nr:PH domain-containing protein [Micromonospora sp. NBRC 107566]
MQWRVTRTLPALKLVAAAVFALLALAFHGDPIALAGAGAVAAGLAGWAVRDLLVPVRLAADADGVTVAAGFAGRRRFAWPRVERVRVDRRPRLGIATETLEIDTGDSLHLLSRYDLGGAEPEEVADALAALRRGRPGQPE